MRSKLFTQHIPQITRAFKKIESAPDAYRYILVRLLLTMCEKPRNDVVVYDKVLNTFKIEDLTPYYRHLRSDPSIKFDSNDIERKYKDFIVHRMLLYDHKRGIRRAAKVGRSTKLYQQFPEIVEFGPDADPTHV